jgi:tetratricopeptide (TPR) repeat protein
MALLQAAYERNRAGRPEEALEILRAASRLDGGNAELHLYIADVYGILGRGEERLQELRTAGRAFSRQRQP